MARRTGERIPALMLLGIVFLASPVSLSYGIAYWEGEKPCHEKCMQSCNTENDAQRQNASQARCNLVQKNYVHGSGSSSKSRRGNSNPFLFKSNSNRFRTLFENEHGYIRLLQRFEHASNQFRNLANVRVGELSFKPNTLLIPYHSDAEFILAVLTGRALVTLLYPNNRDSYILERGDAIKIPAGITFYLINPDHNQNLRAVKLGKSIHGPGQIREFTPSNSQYQKSYFRGFSRNLLEAAFNADYEEIQRTLLGEEEQQERGKQSQFIVRVSKEQIRELSRHAKSSSEIGKSSQNEPINVKSGDPIYSNNFGKFFEVTQEKYPQLQHFNLFLSCVEIKEGAILLPHYNSKAIAIVVVEEGTGEFQLAVPSELDQEDNEREDEDDGEEDESREVKRYSGRLSEGDVVVILAGHPVAFNASSDLRLFAYGIKAKNNRRNFLAGGSDNVLRQIHSQVKELVFAQDATNLMRKQRESHFVSARPQQHEEGKQGKKDPTSSILGSFH